MLIIFSVNDQKITHDLKGQLVAGSVDIVQAAFKFDSSWDELDKIVVFTSSACPKPVPVQFADEAFYIPKDVLKPGSTFPWSVSGWTAGRKLRRSGTSCRLSPFRSAAMAAIVTCCDIWHKVRSPMGKSQKTKKSKICWTMCSASRTLPSPTPEAPIPAIRTSVRTMSPLIRT